MDLSNAAGYVAFHVNGGAWLEPLSDLTDGGDKTYQIADPNAANTVSWWSELPTSSNPEDGPPEAYHYSALRATNFQIQREYGALGSHGGPVLSGRSDHGDLTLERSSDNLSSKLLEYCCDGTQFDWVHVVALARGNFASYSRNEYGGQDKSSPGGSRSGASKLFHIRIQGANVSSYKFDGSRLFSASERVQHGDSTITSPLQNGVTYKEFVTLWYTKIAIDWKSNVGGWDTGANAQWSGSP